MGKVIGKFRLWNLLHESQGTALEEECLVDTGATMVVVPPRVVQALGLKIEPLAVTVTLADGRREKRDVALGLRIECDGRRTECRAIIEPGRDSTRIGRIALEDLDLRVDCKEQKLVPGDPKNVILEILCAGRPVSL